MTHEQFQEHLAELLTGAEYSYLEGFEFGEILEWQKKAADLLDTLSETVEGIPAATIETTLRHRERLGEEAFEGCLTMRFHASGEYPP
jgi:hypothetical protein